MKFLPFVIAAVTAASAQSPVKVLKRAAPEKALVFEVEVPADRAAVWQAFATSDGLSTWLGQRTRVDLRKGGEWTVYFPNGSTGGGTILTFMPETEIVIAALAPKQFPTVRAERTTARFQLESNGKSTTVRLVQTGWKTGEEWDRAYDYLAQGNAQLLESLRQRFVSGPVDWAKE